MRVRILIFGNHDETRNLYSMYLRGKGYEVLDFASPATCALLTGAHCNCPREQVCADLLLADMDLLGMTGLELIRYQRDKGCHAPPRNKAILSTGLNARQLQEVAALGCKSLLKPFSLKDLLAWVHDCERHIPRNRTLLPVSELIAPPKVS